MRPSILSRPTVSVTLSLASTCMFLLQISLKTSQFTRQQRWHNIDTALRKALCEMKLNSFCHLQGEKFLKTSPLSEPLSLGADLKELSLSYSPTWLKLPHEPLALESIILRHLDDGTIFLPNLLNSNHLTCIILHVQAISGAVSLNQWLENSPVYPSLRTFCFAVKTELWDVSDTFLSAKLLPFLSNHTFLTYLDIDIHLDGNLEGFAAIFRQMKLLEFFGFATSAGDEWTLSDDRNLFEYLSPLLSALPSRLSGLEIGTWYCLSLRREVREPYATRETSRTDDRCLSPIESSSLLSRPCSAVSIPKLLPCPTNHNQLLSHGIRT